MDAKEIREFAQLDELKIPPCPTLGASEVSYSTVHLTEIRLRRATMMLLAEGVAQLAELNATLREEVHQDAIEEITVRGERRNVEEFASSKPAQTEHVHDRACAYGQCPKDTLKCHHYVVVDGACLNCGAKGV